MKNTGVIMLGRTIGFSVWGGPGSSKSNPCAPIGVGIQGSAQPGHRLEGRTSPSPPWTSPSGVRHDRGGGTSWVILPPGITPSRRNGPICVFVFDMSSARGRRLLRPSLADPYGSLSGGGGFGGFRSWICCSSPPPSPTRWGGVVCLSPPSPLSGGGVWGVTEGHSSLGRWR